jgi:glycosyltransferase
MKITIITATYNSADTIADCIKSVNNQTCINVEHIIIDGNSKDNTLEVIKSIPNRVAKVISEPDKGIYDALNKGIDLSQGDIIGFLHSDDRLSSVSALETIQQKFKETNADILYGDLFYVSQSDSDKVLRYWKSQSFHEKLLHQGWMPPHPTVFMKKKVYDSYGRFDANFKISADYDLMLRVFKDSSLKKIYLPEVITKMRLGGASNKNIRSLICKSKEDYQALKKNRFKHPLSIVLLKNLSKIPQFLKRHSAN